MRGLLVALMLATAAFSQPVASFSPQSSVRTGETPWFVSVCSASESRVSVGKLYQTLIDHKITPLSYQSAYLALSQKPGKSIWGKLLIGATIATQVTAAALATKVVSGNQNLTNAFTWAGNGIGMIKTIATQQEPPLSPLLTQIPHDAETILVPSGACGSTVILGSLGAAFNVSLP